jgi:hypothetical protein
VPYETFELRQGEHSENTAEFHFDDRDLNITVDNPWSGSTETGFGATCSVHVPKEKARELAEWLMRQLGDYGSNS